MSQKSILSGFLNLLQSKAVHAGDCIIAGASLIYGLYHVLGFSSEPSMTLGITSLVFSAVSIFFVFKKPSDILFGSVIKKQSK